MEGRVSPDTSRHLPGSANYIHLLVKRLDGKIRNLVQKETNHARPHFHTKATGACDVSVNIETAEILAGELSPPLENRAALGIRRTGEADGAAGSAE